MYWRKSIAVLVLLLSGSAFATEGYVLGAGVEGDTEDGLAVSVLGELGLSEQTWLSASLARNTAESPLRQNLDTWLLGAGIDHWWKPVGVRAGVGYWGDNDTLESTDLQASVYWRGDEFSLAGDYEYRDFSILFPGNDFFAPREAGFAANGAGITARFDISDSVSVGVAGMGYDYDVNLKLDSNRVLLQLLTFSRLSLINSLVDYRASANVAVDVGERSWQVDLSTWKGEVDGSKTTSATVRFLTPIGERSDVEFSLGVDDSDLYGNVTFFSVFLFFYGN